MEMGAYSGGYDITCFAISAAFLGVDKHQSEPWAAGQSDYNAHPLYKTGKGLYLKGLIT